MAENNITIRIDEELKKQANELFEELGLTFSAAVTIFVRQALREQGIPFLLTKNISNHQISSTVRETGQSKCKSSKKTNQTVITVKKKPYREEKIMPQSVYYGDGFAEIEANIEGPSDWKQVDGGR